MYNRLQLKVNCRLQITCPSVQYILSVLSIFNTSRLTIVYLPSTGKRSMISIQRYRYFIQNVLTMYICQFGMTYILKLREFCLQFQGPFVNLITIFKLNSLYGIFQSLLSLHFLHVFLFSLQVFCKKCLISCRAAGACC